MRILCLTSRLPYPPYRGDRLRAFNFIRVLAEAHDLYLVSFISSAAEREHIPHLKSYCREVRVVEQSKARAALAVAGNAWRRTPLQVLYYRSAAMQTLVNRMLASQQFDAAYIQMFRMAPYLEQAGGLYRVVDLTDVVSIEVQRSLSYRPPWWRLIYRVEGPRIAAYEQAVTRRFEETWLISQADRLALAALVPEANIQVIPNGVDFEKFRPLDTVVHPNTLLFVGHLAVFHNVDAATYLARQVLPRVRRVIPEATLRLVGAEPAAAVQRLGELRGVEVVGFVPDLNAALNQAAVFVAPLRFAAGVQNKVLEAMAAGRPVVTSGIVNAGLGASPGQHLLVADDPDTTARQVLALLEDEQKSRQLGAAGRDFVTRHFSWEGVRERMAAVEAAVQSGQPQG